MNAKMKVLSLAMVGLLGFAGAASAACPSSPVPPWSSVSAFQGTANIVSGGYAGTDCRMESKINSGASTAASGAVNWTGTTAEARYRAHFIVNVDALTGQTITQGVNIFTANSTTGGDGVRFSVFGSGSTHQLGYFVRYDDPATGRRYKTGAVPLVAGENHVEFDLQAATGSTTGSFSLWVNSNVEANVTKTETGLTNAALGGIDTTYVGLAAPSKQFITAYPGIGVGFDQFDSRRQTFIGY